MDLFKDLNVASASQPTKRSKQGEQSEGVQETMLVMSKLLLSVAQAVRQHAAVLSVTWLIPTDGVLHRCCREATQRWQQVKESLIENGLKGEELKLKLGPPSAAVVNALVKMLMDQQQDGPEKQLMETVIAESKTWQDIAKCFPMCCIRKAHKGETKKLIISCPEERLIQVAAVQKSWTLFMTPMRALINKNKAKELVGTAPPGDLERKLQRWIDAKQGNPRSMGDDSE